MPHTEDAIFYQLYFQSTGVAEQELERDVRHSGRSLLYAPTERLRNLRTSIWNCHSSVMKLGELIRSFLLGSDSWEQFSILLARVSIGGFLAISGGSKLFVASRTHQMYETLSGAGIPLPHFMTYLVSSVEFIGGCLLVVGLLSSLCCAALVIQMIVAITTVRLATIPAGLSSLSWLDEFLYLPETLYSIILIWLICSGPGRVSIDSRLFRADK